MSGHSDTIAMPLTDEQRAWANAMLRAMGGKGNVSAPVKPPPAEEGAAPTLLQGGLAEFEMAATQDLQPPRSALAGVDEDVRRKKLVGYSSDKQYKKNIVDPIDKMLAAIDALIAKGSAVNEQTLPELNTLQVQLTQERQRYRDGIAGEKNAKKRAQRQAKVDAISRRLDALQQLSWQSGQVQGKREALLATADPKARASMLAQNPEILKAVIAAKPPPRELGALIHAIDNAHIDSVVRDVLDEHGDDETYMDLLSGSVVDLEVAGSASVGTFLRSNSTAAKLTAAYARSSMQDLTEAVRGDCRAWLQGARMPIEIDPAKQREGEGQAEAQESAQQLMSFVRALLGQVVGQPVPRSVAVTASMIASGAREMGMDPHDVGVMIGGHLMLRVVTPLLVTVPDTPEVPIGPAQRRALILASKVAQNVSNDMPGPSKEPFMDLFSDFVAAEMPNLHRWFMEVAADGDEARGLPADATVQRALVQTLSDSRLDIDQLFLPADADDPLGTLPAQPDSQIAALIITARAENPPSPGIVFVPNASHAKLVGMERRKLIERILALVQAHHTG